VTQDRPAVAVTVEVAVLQIDTHAVWRINGSMPWFSQVWRRAGSLQPSGPARW